MNASSTTSILERALSRCDITRDHLAPREFLALVPRGPEVPVGVPKVYEEGSLHLIFGNW